MERLDAKAPSHHQALLPVRSPLIPAAPARFVPSREPLSLSSALPTSGGASPSFSFPPLLLLTYLLSSSSHLKLTGGLPRRLSGVSGRASAGADIRSAAELRS